MLQKKNIKVVLAGLGLLFITVFHGALFQPAMAIDPKECVKTGKVPLAIKINGQDCIARDQIIVTWAKGIIQFLSAGIGLAVVGGVITGGIMYATARDNAAQTQKAIMIITNSIVGLILFIMLFAIINYIIPGGVIS